MKALSLGSTERTAATGKGSARSFRREGMVPAVLYGSSMKSTKLLVNLIELQKLFRSSGTSQFLLDLHLDGAVRKVTIKELQRRPVTGEILHVDFYEVAMDRKIKISVPITTVGVSKGVELGGILQIIRHEVEVLCFPDKIPGSVKVDISGMDVGDSLHVLDIAFADGLEIAGESNFTVLTVLSQKTGEDGSEKMEQDDETDDLEEEGVTT